jgi:uncharacterized protein YdeI (YjbR/CyaY-like superfamily)
MPGPTETFFAPDRATWRVWLEEHHADRSEVWLLLLKKHVPEPCVTLDEAIEEALCFGWVDSRLRSLGDREHALRFSPRKPTGTWAPSNKARVERLIREGRMAPAGLAAIEAAKRSGAWESLDHMEDYDVVPDDLAAALAAEPGAAVGFAAFTVAQRRDYVRWAVRAVRPETRARRVAEVARRAGKGLKPGVPER